MSYKVGQRPCLSLWSGKPSKNRDRLVIRAANIMHVLNVRGDARHRGGTQSRNRLSEHRGEPNSVNVDAKQNRRQRLLASTTVFGVLVVLSLIAVGVARHPASVQGSGSGLLRIDIALLLLFGSAGVWAWYHRRP